VSQLSVSDQFNKADVRVLFVTRLVRMFAYGFLSVLLALYLAQLGLSDAKIGLLLSLTLVGGWIFLAYSITNGTRTYLPWGV